MDEKWEAGVAVDVSETNEGTETLKYTVKNPQRTDNFPVYVEKVNPDNQPLSYGAFDVCVENVETGEVTVVGTIQTREEGKGNFQKVPLRENVKYYLKEIYTPQNLKNNREDYTQSLGRIFPFTPNEDNKTYPVRVTAKNTPKSQSFWVNFRKIEMNTGKYLQGAKFRIYKDKACTIPVLETSETNENGYTATVSLDDGTYYVKEIQYPEGGNWKKLESPVEFSVSGRLDGSTKTIYIENEKEPPQISIYKYDSVTKEPLAGAQFKITGDGLPGGMYVSTGSDGYYRISPTENEWLYDRMIEGGAIIGEINPIASKNLQHRRDIRNFHILRK